MLRSGRKGLSASKCWSARIRFCLAVGSFLAAIPEETIMHLRNTRRWARDCRESAHMAVPYFDGASCYHIRHLASASATCTMFASQRHEICYSADSISIRQIRWAGASTDAEERPWKCRGRCAKITNRRRNVIHACTTPFFADVGDEKLLQLL